LCWLMLSFWSAAVSCKLWHFRSRSSAYVSYTYNNGAMSGVWRTYLFCFPLSKISSLNFRRAWTTEEGPWNVYSSCIQYVMRFE
jgi:hypothetical protein